MNACTVVNTTDQLSICNEIGLKITTEKYSRCYLTYGLKTSGSTQLIFLSFVLQLLRTEMQKELTAHTCTESSRSQRPNKPVGASLFCPLLMKQMGRVKGGWLLSISSGQHFRAWQVAELAVPAGRLSSIRAWSYGLQRWSYCLLSPGQLLPLQSVERQTVPEQVSFPFSFGSLMSPSVWALGVETHFHLWDCIRAQRRQLRWEEPQDMEPATFEAAGRGMWHGSR